MKKIFVLLALAFLCTAVAAADDDNRQTIDPAKLPTQAINNLKAYFADVEVTEAYAAKSKIKNEYGVTLANGTTIVFDKNGQWSEVVANGGEVPTRMLNPRVVMYLNEHHPGTKVVMMRKDKKGNFEFRLDNDVELHFNDQYKPITKK